jgi:hypothetical protein
LAILVGLVSSSGHGLVVLTSAKLEETDRVRIGSRGIIKEELLASTNIDGMRPNYRHGVKNWVVELDLASFLAIPFILKSL